ncbi:MAG: HYR domain-containing protein [Acidobacteriota bacterium]
MGLGYGDARTAATSKDDIRLEQVRIEVLLDDPGGHKPAEPGATVRVAILSTESFDATSIDPASITIEGVPVVRRKNGKARASIQDVNGDDLMDLIVRVNAEGLHITTEPKKIAMQGATLDGRLVQGGGCVRSSGIPCAGELLSPPDGKSRSGKAGKKNVSIAAVNATIVSAGATLVSESCTPPNGALDPNETVTVSFCIQNTGVGNTTKLIGTLQATGGVTNPSGPQDYGVVVAGGPPVCRNVTFTVTGTCGGTITASIQFQDGATNLGTVTYTFTLGTLVVVFQENFDGVTEPALPAGWTPSQGVTLMGGPLWVTSTTTPDTAPNDAFSTAPNHTFDNRLDTPLIAILTGSAQLIFRNNFDLNDSGGGFDGAVLEISSPNIESGDFTGITAAGGSFVSGGYNMTIPEDQPSVIAGRSAWSGTSGGYITTVVNLPAAVAGQSITLRFRLACDNNVASVGWRIDTIRITDGFVCSTTCPPPACTITCPGNQSPSAATGQCFAVVTYAAPTTTGTCGTVTCSPASGSMFPIGTTIVTCASTAGPSCSFAVTVNDTQAPVITCPGDITTTTTINSPCAVATFAPTATDNCPGVTTLCSPASGSCFAVGTTTVTCTATDSSSNTATCSFTVSVFNVCLQDDSNPGIVFLGNTVTGDYRFCCRGTIFTGRAQVTRKGNIATFEQFGPDRKVLAKYDGGVNRGSASIQSQVASCTITDRDTRNNSCVCQ